MKRIMVTILFLLLLTAPVSAEDKSVKSSRDKKINHALELGKDSFTVSGSLLGMGVGALIGGPLGAGVGAIVGGYGGSVLGSRINDRAREHLK